MRAWLVIGVLALVSFVAFRGCFGGASTSWNQRLTLVVETPQGEVRGSAVTRVENVTFGPLSLADTPTRVRWTGEAVALEVLPGRWLFALLDSDGAVDAGHWVYTVYDLWAGGGSNGYHFPRYKAARTFVPAQPHDAPVPLPPEAWPMLVTFDDITKPETVREVDPADLAAMFGEGVRLKAVTLEITEEAMTEGRVEGRVEGVLGSDFFQGWAKHHNDEMKGGFGDSYLNSLMFKLNRNVFVADKPF